MTDFENEAVAKVVRKRIDVLMQYMHRSRQQRRELEHGIQEVADEQARTAAELRDLGADVTIETVTVTYTFLAEPPSADAEDMNFGQALDALRRGDRVARRGWNGKGMWLVLVPGSEVMPRPGTPYAIALGEDRSVRINAHIDMRTATGEMQPGWLASQTDMLATDWVIVGEDLS